MNKNIKELAKLVKSRNPDAGSIQAADNSSYLRGHPYRTVGCMDRANITTGKGAETCIKKLIFLIFAAMIAFIRGNFVYKTPAVVHVEAHGVGYELHISLNTFSDIQHLEKGLLYTHLHIREDAHILYGFSEVTEKELFLQLVSVSGVGTATARMMLSSLKPEELVRAIVQGNTRQLESIKGIGKKSAERIVLELRDKLGKTNWDTNIGPLRNNTLEQDALNALMALGIARAAGEQAVQKVMKAHPDLTVVEDIIKNALKTL